MKSATETAAAPAAAHDGARQRQATVPEVFFAQARRLASKPYLRSWAAGEWRTLTWSETAERAMRVACGLVEAGLQVGDTVILMAPNRPDWLYCDVGILAAGGITVPVYPSLPGHTAAFIARDAKARFAVVSDQEMAGKFTGRDHPDVIFTMEGEIAHWTAQPPGDEVRGRVEARLSALRTRDLATVVYTSGTTGDPKGVMLTHSNFVAMAESALKAFDIGPEDELLSYLPYSHVLERIDGWFIETMAGCSFWLARSLDQLVEDIQSARPTIMLGVPRVFEKVYEAVNDQVRTQSILKRAVFRWALGVGVARLTGEPGPWLRLRVRVAERLVLRPLRERLTGGRLRFFISGGAPLNEKVEQFFWAIGVKILQGWGLTEASSAVTSNTEERHRYRTVGVPLPGTKIRIAEDGEILVQGPGVMAGYKNLERATAETIVDGWLQTGDMGFIDQDGFLTITDRKKDLIKTSGGKYVAPLPLESELESDRFVKSAIVIGDRRPYVIALIVPDRSAISPEDENADLRSRFATLVDRVNQGQASFETIKHFALLERDFAEDQGELTPTLKKKRRVIAEHFAPVIDRLYEENRRA